MDDKTNTTGVFYRTSTRCAVAALAGLIVFLLLFVLIDWSVISAFFWGAVVFILIVLLGASKFGQPVSSAEDVSAPDIASNAGDQSTTDHQAPPSPLAAETGHEGVLADAAPDAGEPDAGEAMPPDAADGPAEAMDAGGEPVAAADPIEPPTSPPAAPEPVLADQPDPVEQDAAPAIPIHHDIKPVGLAAPRPEGADDLKQIKGVGPKLEVLCNTLGFWHFDQIAGWTDEEVAWVDGNLEGFKGRVTRDAWVAQAKRLAAGGDAGSADMASGGDAN